jgi:hypothetical protein
VPERFQETKKKKKKKKKNRNRRRKKSGDSGNGDTVGEDKKGNGGGAEPSSGLGGAKFTGQIAEVHEVSYAKDLRSHMVLMKRRDIRDTLKLFYPCL